MASSPIAAAAAATTSASSPLGLATADAARHVGIGRSTLEKLRLTGGGPPFAKLGKIVRYRPADLDAWVASKVVNSTSERVR